MDPDLPALIGLSVVLSIVLGAALGAARRLRRRRGAWRSDAAAALAACTRLIEMLAALQQHRGLSSAWLAGDAAFEARMHARRRDIDALMPALMQAAAHENGMTRPRLTVQDATLFRHRWRELTDGLERTSPEHNIAAHTRQIERLTAIIAALGEARIELPGAAALPPGLARNFAYRLPALSECLGQARAIGSAAAAAGHCSAVARVRLLFLATRAESLLRQAGEVDGGQASGLHARQQVDRLATLVRTGLLAGPRTTVAAETYFATATAAIDSVFAWIGASAQTLQQALEARDPARVRPAVAAPALGRRAS